MGREVPEVGGWDLGSWGEEVLSEVVITQIISLPSSLLFPMILIIIIIYSHDSHHHHHSCLTHPLLPPPLPCFFSLNPNSHAVSSPRPPRSPEKKRRREGQSYDNIIR